MDLEYQNVFYHSVANRWIECPVLEQGALLERGFILEPRKWQTVCLESEGRWFFPNPVTGRPYHADSIRADHLVPTGLQLGLGRIGFHTFRHYAGSRTMPHRVLSKLGLALKSAAKPLPLMRTHAA